MSDAPTCCAWIDHGWSRGIRCPKPAKHAVDHYGVCGTHKRVAERWQKQGRLVEMVKYWWKV
jgi:hypothetical protein